jgi:U3 small nucleolar ribonucleoprotein component
LNLYILNQVNARLVRREFRSNNFDSLEQRFGQAVTALQEEPSIQAVKRIRLLKIMERFNGDIEQVRQFLSTLGERHHGRHEHFGSSRRQQRDELKTKYATQLAELATAGVDVNHPSTFRQLVKTDGDVNKVRFFRI